MVGSKEYFIGQDAEDKRGVLNLINPIKRVMVKDWDYVEKIWDHIFERELRINPAECTCKRFKREYWKNISNHVRNF